MLEWLLWSWNCVCKTKSLKSLLTILLVIEECMSSGLIWYVQWPSKNCSFSNAWRWHDKVTLCACSWPYIYVHEIVTIVGLSNPIHIYIYLNLVTNCYKKSLYSDKHVHIILLWIAPGLLSDDLLTKAIL